jgi:hypothetical protein
MAENADLSSAVLATIHTCDKVIDLTQNYILHLKNFPPDLHQIRNQLSTTKAALERLKFVQTLGGKASSQLLLKLGGHAGPVDICKASISELELLLSPKPRSSAATKRRKIESTTEILNWPTVADRAFALLNSVSESTATVVQALPEVSKYTVLRVSSHLDVN